MLQQEFERVVVNYQPCRLAILETNSPIVLGRQDARIFLVGETRETADSEQTRDVFELTRAYLALNRGVALAWANECSDQCGISSPCLVTVPDASDDIDRSARALYGWLVQLLGRDPVGLWVRVVAPERGGRYEWAIGYTGHSSGQASHVELMNHSAFPHKVRDGHRVALESWRDVAAEHEIPFTQDIWP